MKAIVLLSGGLDSATALAVAKSHGYECYALTADYGQRHRAEVESACAIADRSAVAGHMIIDLKVLGELASSALTRDDIEVPKGRSAHDIADGVPSTYVPARNLVLLSLATSWAETIGAAAIFTGFNVLDASGYPDCRPDFVYAFENVAYYATKRGSAPVVKAPLIHLTKAEIIRLGTELGVDYSITHTCYDPRYGRADVGDPKVWAYGSFACGECDACQLRRKGFEEAGIPDPTRYASQALWLDKVRA
jgi:7-cyano-7-deazaguanine synthase